MDKNLLQKAKAPMIALINPQALKGRPDHNHGCNPWSVIPRTLLLLFLALLAPVAAQAQFGGGTGAYDNPYRIETTDHWLELADSVNNGNDYYNKLFYLYNDLDFSGINFIPIGGGNLNGNDTRFSGIFDGRDHCIRNVQLSGNRNVGLFGDISFGTVMYLTLGGNSRIEGKHFVGGIVGTAGCCNIINCHVEKTVTIAATAYQSFGIGGIIGSCYNGYSEDEREIRDCTNAATVTTGGHHLVRRIGGIAGEIESRGQSIRNCKNYGTVSGHEYVGGVVGYFNFNKPGNTLENCYTGGNCTLNGVGQEGSSQGINLEGKAVTMHTITFGENVNGSVYSRPPTGSFEGKDYYAAGREITLYLYPDTSAPEGYISLFDVNGERQQFGYVEMTMPAENVNVTIQYLRDIAYSPWVSISFSPESFEYNGSVQGPDDITVTDIKDGNSVVLTEGIDYEVIPGYGITPGDYWIDINGLGQYAGTAVVWYSITSPSANWIGEGTEESPYLIYTTDDMHRLALMVYDRNSFEGKHFSLQNDLDFSGKDYMPIGGVSDTRSFKGTFNGNGHSVSNVVIQSPSTNYVGLFVYIGEGGSVNGLTLGEGSSIEGMSYVAGIAAICHGTVSDCSTAEGVTIKANENRAGGIVCRLSSTGRVANCQNHADVSANGELCGGIAAMMEGGEVSGCINDGSVEAGTWKAGGIVAELTQHGIVRDCVNEGSVSSGHSVGGIVGIIGSDNIDHDLRRCLNLGAVSASNNSDVGGIVGKNLANVNHIVNNYYAGACTVGGINGSDLTSMLWTRATYGYTVSGENGITFRLRSTTKGVSYKGNIYAGRNQRISIDIIAPEGYAPLNGYSASAGTLTSSGIAWSLTMPDDEDVVITADLGLALTVPGYGESTSAGWRFIASPVVGSVAATEVVNLFAATEYDLYRFNQSATLEWENYKQEGDHFQFAIENGQGYLYASEDDVTLVFGGTYNEAETQDVPLVYDGSASFAGWNLVGNPFPVAAYANRSYYTMNAEGTGIEPVAVSSSTAIEACTGVMVKAETTGEKVTFSRTSQQSAGNNGTIQIAVSQADTRGNAIQDKAIVSFNAGDRLEKFVFGETDAKIYIPQGGKDYAVATVGRDAPWHVSTTDEILINFKAAKNGTYTLTFDTQNLDLDYLHLIDNMTGADIDLLSSVGASTGSAAYTFAAKTTDYASRFRLVFSNDDAGGDACEPDAPFAYVSNGNIVITADMGDATLQIVDVMGRVVVSYGGHTRCVPTTGIPAGVYVLRLVDGENVRTQKVVID